MLEKRSVSKRHKSMQRAFPNLRVMPDMPMTRRVKEGSAPSSELEQREADKRRRRFAEFGLALEKADNA